MISIEQATHVIDDIPHDQLMKFTINRITGKNATPIGSGYGGESSEDVIIQFLKKDIFYADKRSEIIKGCEHVCYEIIQHLIITMNSLDDCQDYLHETAFRLCRILDIAAPRELRHPTFFMCYLSLLNLEAQKTREAIVRATMAYANTANDIELWLSVVKHENVAAYAFNVLIKICHDDQLLDQILQDLQQKEKFENWPIDTKSLSKCLKRSRSERE